MTRQGWRPGKSINYMQIPDSDPAIQKLIEERAGMGEGIYVADNPAAWYPKPSERPDGRIFNSLGEKPKVYEVQFLDRADAERWNYEFSNDGPNYFTSDFPARGNVSLLRELPFEEIAKSMKPKG
jgi:hypothetical protein